MANENVDICTLRTLTRLQDQKTRIGKPLHEMLAPLFTLVTGLASAPFETIGASRVLDPRTGAAVSPLHDLGARSLVVLLPQLGEFDSAEMVEQLLAVEDDLAQA